MTAKVNILDYNPEKPPASTASQDAGKPEDSGTCSKASKQAKKQTNKAPPPNKDLLQGKYLLFWQWHIFGLQTVGD